MGMSGHSKGMVGYRARNRLLAVLATTAIGVAVLVPVTRDDSLTRLQAAGVIRIGYAVEPPFAFVDARGEVTGESPEVARRVVPALGIPRIEWRQVEFGKLIDELEAGRIDTIAAGMFVTAERASRVAFSVPSFHVSPGLLVADGNPLRLHGALDAFERPGVRLAVIAGSVEESLLRQRDVEADRLIRVPDALTGRRTVETGLADALVLSSPTVRWMATDQVLGRSDVLVSTASGGSLAGYGRGAFAFRQSDAALRQAWDAVLREYVGGPDHRQLLARLGFPESTVAALPAEEGR